jgi:DnaK suppressor protein
MVETETITELFGGEAIVVTLSDSASGLGVYSMKKHQIKHLENLLRNQLRDLLTHGEHTITGIRSQDQYMSDPLDRASYDEDQSRLFRIRDRESRLIKKIKNALEAIEDGTYGICESCSEEISFQRLLARPVTTKCITCKMREEELEKAARMR